MPPVTSLLIACFLDAPSLDGMRAAIADRLAALDHLVLDVRTTGFTLPRGASPLDRTQWTPTHAQSFENRLTIVRPDVLAESLLNTPTYSPTLTSLSDGVLTSKRLRPSSAGTTFWTRNARNIGVNWYSAYPLLWFCDIQLQDCAVTQLNLLRVFDEYHPHYVRTLGEVHTFAANVPMADYQLDYEVDLNIRGTPLRSTIVVRTLSGELIGRWELLALAFREVNGAQLCTEAVSTVHNPSVSVSWNGLQHFAVTADSHVPSLTCDDVRLDLDLRNAVVEDEGRQVVEYYDADGRLLRMVASRFNALADIDEPTARRDRARTSAGISAVIGLLTGVGLARPRSSSGQRH
ncbi:MAG: hypothetical protein CHACPFDD_00817 [Phycisphaerae bacterium]|nr:hypothetical protein [Phycisphaerae bacterium]